MCWSLLETRKLIYVPHLHNDLVFLPHPLLSNNLANVPPHSASGSEYNNKSNGRKVENKKTMNLFKRLELPKKMRVPVRSPDWKSEGLPRLELRLRALANDDNLVPLLLQLLDEFGANEIDAGLQSGLDDAEAHRFRGRLGMNVELRSEIEQAWIKSRQPKEQK